MKYPKTHFIDSPRTYLFTAENHTSSEYSKKQHQFIIVLLIYTLFYYILYITVTLQVLKLRVNIVYLSSVG
jgi:hypothetical protein